MQENWPTLACPSNSGSTFWAHEWEKHGTCSESVLDQHSYFKTALTLKSKADLLQILQSAGNNMIFFIVLIIGISPDGGFYSLSTIRNTIRNAIGYSPGIECNVDEDGNTQLYQIYICVDTSGTNFIDCPVFPNGKCASTVEFPSF
ncbi:Ribonuclease T(2) [Handroanthus impetiginosus]|uniref:Ribonuclease T(2) n=1 Tax=Handroanthus impetiginosus TaxID=429701 RepID=A0A2G9H8D6_9LAMI|nr:Ribonuclease T(2) [Handroanthus impetiginosus]